MGDSAFQNTMFMIGAYKKLPKQQLPKTQKWFNDLLSKPRSTVEHTIGIYKGRFPFLRQIRFRIRRGRARKDMKRIIRYVKACAILHNLLLAHIIPDKWIDQNTEKDNENNTEGDDDVVEVGGNRREMIHNHLAVIYA